MSNTRREFLQTSAAVAVGLIGGTSSILADTPKATPAAAKPASPATPAAMDMVQVPTMKFGGVDISRMVLGVNPLYGYAHYNLNFASSMADWYTADKVVEVMKRGFVRSGRERVEKFHGGLGRADFRRVDARADRDDGLLRRRYSPRIVFRHRARIG